MNLDDVEALLSPEGLAALKDIRNEEVELSSFLLSRDGVLSKNLLHGLAEQIRSRKLLKKKHPSLFNKGVLCEKSLLEQSTAEEVARYRATLLKGETCIDCTGGMGIDLLYLMGSFQRGVYCELDEGRARLFSYNKEVLSHSSIDIVVGNSIEYLQKSTLCFDVLFIDPARRSEHERFFSLERSMPNIVEHWELLLQKAVTVVVKLSPMIDVSKTLAQLSHIQRVEVVSLDGEVKEVMLVASCESRDKPEYRATLLRTGCGVVSAVVGEKLVAKSDDVSEYLYDCDSAVVKAGLVGTVAEHFKLKLVHSANQLLTGNTLVSGFPGRSFKVLSVQSWQRKSLKKYLKLHRLQSAVVVSRGVPLSVQELRKFFALKEADDVFLFFTVDLDGKKIVIHCERIHA